MRLFEGFDADVMVLQRDEQEVFDEAIHVFFDREYYDAYVGRAKKYSNHSYAYHEDKLGEVIYQIFDENIPGIVFHMSSSVDGPKGILCDEKYIKYNELKPIEDAARNYHLLYNVSIERMAQQEAVGKLWGKDVYIIGQLMPTVQFMTMKRKNDGTPVTDDTYDYESIKIFLTPDSAMKFNPDNKPINRYKLGMISTVVKGKLKVIIEPHRGYWLEYDPANIDISDYFQMPQWNEESVSKRIADFAKLDEIFVLLSSKNSDYRSCVGTPFIMKEGENMFMYLFEKYEDALRYVYANPAVLPVYDGIEPIGVLRNDAKLATLNTLIAVCSGLGVSGVYLDNETEKGICCKLPFFIEKAGLSTELESFLSEEDCKLIKKTDGDSVRYSMPLIPFIKKDNEYAISDERKAELAAMLEKDDVTILSFMAGIELTEMMFMLNETARRYDEYRKVNDTGYMARYGSLLNLLTTPIAEALYDLPYLFSIKNDDGSFVTKNDLPYLLITNRFESGRSSEGRPVPVSFENEEFVKDLMRTARIAILTDGPNVFCLVDVHMISEKIKERRKNETLHEEMMIYMTQGCGLSYAEADLYYKRLKADSALFNEFVSNVRNGAFSAYGAIEINGVTAMKLVEKKDISMLEAYIQMLDMEINTLTPMEERDEEESETDSKQEKKSLFGKMFKR